VDSVILLVLIVAALVGALVWSSRQRAARQVEQARELAQVKGVAESDVTAFGESLGRLQLVGSQDEAVAQDYQRALDCYDRASAALGTAAAAQDLAAVSSALEEGRYSLACAQARVSGQPLPERRPPCFFDARHGPSTTDAQWAPPGGQPRAVPVCAADATRLADGVEPAWRPVPVGNRTAPPWNAGPAYGPWFGGAYGAYSGLLPGLLMGTMLGSSLGWGDTGFDGGDGDGGGDSGGDFGDSGGDSGGDFGDFGDFGGGDF
jgi:hypothetical protein